MNTHYRTTLDHTKLKNLGLLSEDFVPEGMNRGLPKSFIVYTEKALTPEESDQLCLFRGINQLKDTVTLEIKVGTVIQLDSVDPKAPSQTVFIEFHSNYWSVYAKDREAAKDQTSKLYRTNFMIPLMPPATVEV